MEYTVEEIATAEAFNLEPSEIREIIADFQTRRLENMKERLVATFNSSI